MGTPEKKFMIATFLIVALVFIESPLLAAELSVRLETAHPGGTFILSCSIRPIPSVTFGIR